MSLEYFDEHQESYSSSILRELTKSPFFKPRLRKDGTVTDKDLLLVAATVIAASDERIRRVEHRLTWWNQPLLQPALAARDLKSEEKDEAIAAETNWFVRQLTLRNVGGVTVVLVGAIWAFFTWFVTDKSAEVVRLQSQLTIVGAQRADAEKSRDQLEKDFGFYKDNVKAASDNAEAIKKDRDSLQGANTQLQKQISDLRAENSRLIDTLGKIKTPPAPTPPTK